MANPLFNGNGGNANMNGITQMVQRVKNSANPQALFNQLLQENPQARQQLDALRQQSGGKSYQQIVMQLFQQNGINPQEFMKNILG